MTFPTRDDLKYAKLLGPPDPEDPEIRSGYRYEPKPRLDWLLLLALTLDLGVWVGLLAWWIWR